MNGFLVVLLFWLPTLLAIFALVAGIGYRSPGLLWSGALLSLPFSLYLFAMPRFGWVALLIPLAQAAGAVALRRISARP